MDDMRNGRVDESHISVGKTEIWNSTFMTKEFDISGMKQMLNLEGILLTSSHYHTNRYEGVFFFMEEYI